MNSAAWVVLIMGGIIAAIIIAWVFGETIMEHFGSFLAALFIASICIASIAVLWVGVVLTIQAVQYNNVGDAFLSFLITIVGGVFFIGSLILVVGVLRDVSKRRR